MIHRDLEDYERIDEEKIRARADVKKSKSLLQLLRVADEWREAGCTPVFIIAQEDPMIIACVAEETFGREYN